MSHSYFAIRDIAIDQTFSSNDFLVLFGELFPGGYANGLVEEAQKRGMIIVYATVGRRDDNNQLRPLLANEKPQMSGPFINIPLEAGFDLEPDDQGLSPVDQLRPLKLSNWQEFSLSRQSLEQSKNRGRLRFQAAVKNFVSELQKIIPPPSKVLFAHLMAGGVPRAKIVMPLMNRAFKGTGERYLPSEVFWNSGIGQLVAESFLEVTAHTFDLLIKETESFRKKHPHVSYLAYGYHGTEVLINNQFQWQTYTPYLQGWAKKQLENLSRHWFSQVVHCAIYNCPEILTNSSSIFQGVEVSLYPLLQALKQSGHAKSEQIVKKCLSLLKNNIQLEQMMDITNEYFQHSLIKERCQFDLWPQHSSQMQLEKMLDTSDKLISLHQDEKNLMTFSLSEVVFASCGHVMINSISQPPSPVIWINHDIVSRVHSTL